MWYTFDISYLSTRYDLYFYNFSYKKIDNLRQKVVAFFILLKNIRLACRTAAYALQKIKELPRVR